MRTRWTITATLTLILVFSAGCSPLLSPARSSVAPPATLTPRAALPSTAVPAVSVTLTPQAFSLDLTPLPTPSALPPLELPTAPAYPQGMQVWDGLPTYPAESRPDFYFRVWFDPASWALTTNQFGYPVLANRSLAGCVLGPAVGRGLPFSGSVDHEVRRIGAVTYQVSTASVSGVTPFVNYAGGNGVIYTAFEVAFVDQAELCLTAAEGVLGTLSSVPLSEATAIPGQ